MTDVHVRRLRIRLPRSALPQARQIAREIAKQLGTRAQRDEPSARESTPALRAELPAQAATLPPSALARRIEAALTQGGPSTRGKH